MNSYSENLKFVKEKILKYVSVIFKVYGSELLLKLEDYNLLRNPDNCIESSTATGYIMEEFIVSKLEIFTKEHDGVSDIKIQRRNASSTAKSSYDCCTVYNGIFIMINIKMQKDGGSNDAVAAINILHNDYVCNNPKQQKAYMVLKTVYSYNESKKDGERKIIVKDSDAYFLEEIDFSKGYVQDRRNWSKELNLNSGRLKISDKWRVEHLSEQPQISYGNTQSAIDLIFKENQKKRKKKGKKAKNKKEKKANPKIKT